MDKLNDFALENEKAIQTELLKEIDFNIYKKKS